MASAKMVIRRVRIPPLAKDHVTGAIISATAAVPRVGARDTAVPVVNRVPAADFPDTLSALELGEIATGGCHLLLLAIVHEGVRGDEIALAAGRIADWFDQYLPDKMLGAFH